MSKTGDSIGHEAEKRKPSKRESRNDPVRNSPPKAKPKQSGVMADAHREHPTGIEGVDAGGMGSCRKSKGEGCFLDPWQRNELNQQVHSRIDMASKNYTSALVRLQIEQIIKKVDELPWYATLLLGACATALESVAGLAIKALKAPGAAAQAVAAATTSASDIKESLKEAVEEANNVGAELAKNASSAVGKEATHQAEKEVSTLSEKELESFVKTSIDIGKDKAKGLIVATSEDSSEANEKRQALGYVSILGHKGDIMFDQLSQDVGRQSDAMALAMWHSMDPANHDPDVYYGKLAAALERYSESTVSKMGREKGFEGTQHVEKEVRLAKVLVPGAGVRYAYMDRVFDGWYREAQLRHPGEFERNSAYDSSQNALSLQQQGDWSFRGQEQTRSETPLGPDRMLNYVEPEFQELAIQKQKQIWLAEPEVFQMTYNQGYPQLVKVAGS